MAKEPFSGVALRLLRGGGVILGHVALGMVVIASIWAFHWLFIILWGEKDPRLFDWIPIRYLFDASELGVMLVFIGMGTYELFHELKR